MPETLFVGQPMKRSGIANIMLTKTATIHIAAEDLTVRPNLRSITPPAIIPNMAEGIFKPPVKRQTKQTGSKDV